MTAAKIMDIISRLPGCDPLGVSAPSENPARLSHNQQRTQQPHAYTTIGMISLSVDLLLSADSLDGFT